MKKNSQIFIFDLIFSVVILVVSLGIAFSYYINTSKNTDIYNLNVELMNGLTKTEINDLNGQEIRNMFKERLVTNIHNTVGQQVAYFISIGNISRAENLTDIFVKNYVQPQMYFNISISNSTDSYILFEKVDNNIISKKNSQLLSVTQRRVIGFLNDASDTYYKYTYKIEIWV